MLLSCSSTHHSGTAKAMPGTWQSTPIIIDGDSKDWPSPYPNYDAKAKVAYATSNDGQNLYITMQTGDEATQLKILKQGMTVSIDTNGKKEAQFNINYPLQNDNEPLDLAKPDRGQENKSQLARKQSEQKITRLLQDANQFTMDGFANCSGGYMISQTLPCGVKVRARIDEFRELVWEAVIPFRVLYNRDSIVGSDARRPISVCYQVKGFKANGPKNDNGANTAGMNNGMGGAGTNSAMRNGIGQIPRGRGGSRNSSDDPMHHYYETTKTWKQFGIAVKP